MVIIVTMQPADADVLTSAIREAGYAQDVRIANSLEQALSLIAERVPALAVVDLRIDGNGIEAAARIAALAPEANVVIVNGEHIEQARLLSTGAPSPGTAESPARRSPDRAVVTLLAEALRHLPTALRKVSDDAGA